MMFVLSEKVQVRVAKDPQRRPFSPSSESTADPGSPAWGILGTFLEEARLESAWRASVAWLTGEEDEGLPVNEGQDEETNGEPGPSE